jgi:hypothetical protein
MDCLVEILSLSVIPLNAATSSILSTGLSYILEAVKIVVEAGYYQLMRARLCVDYTQEP